MGQTLSSPDTEKHTKSGVSRKFAYGLCEMQGWRTSMEDAHVVEMNLDGKEEESNAFFAVYDGHGGSTVAKFSGENVHKRLVSDEAYKQGNFEVALKNAFLGTDEDIRAESRFYRDPSGCTAVVALVTREGRIIVANAGDSRAILCVNGQSKPLSHDHKPLNEPEMNRIKNAGGYVEYGRVNGNLALSRAIGDFEFKKNASLPPEEQMITANPEIIEYKPEGLEGEEEFIVIACDGIWDCLSSQQVADVIRLQVSQGKELEEISSFLCDLCLAPDTTAGAGLGCDNMTVLIVALLNGRTKEEWYSWITDRVKRKEGYPTPEEIPQLYAPARINAFKARKAAYDDRMARGNSSSFGGYNGGFGGFGMDEDFGGLSSVFGGRAIGVGGPLGFARSMLGTGIQFHPSRSQLDDSDEDSDEEDMELTLPTDDDNEEREMDRDAEDEFFRGLGMRTPINDITKSLRAQLDELEESDSPVNSEPRDEELSNPGDEAQQAFGARMETDGASAPEHITTNGFSSKTSGGEAPMPPKSLANGDLKIQQLESSPGGDKASSAVEAEGLMDTSESVA